MKTLLILLLLLPLSAVGQDSTAYFLPPEVQETLLELAKDKVPAVVDKLIDAGQFMAGGLLALFAVWVAPRLQRKKA